MKGLEIMKIPESLSYRIMRRKCILFLGAGATVSSGGATGEQLGKSIYDSIGNTGIEAHQKLAIYTQQLVDKGYRDEIEDIIRKRFKNLKPTPDFACIANIPWKAIYTTNYDDLVEKSYDLQHFYTCVVSTTRNEKSIHSEIEVPLYKINGDINTPFMPEYPLIITFDDLKNTRKSRESILRRLMHDLNDTFVFVGYSFEDTNELITQMLDILNEDEKWESVKEKYAVLPEVSIETELVLKQHKINIIKGCGDDFFRLLSDEAQRDYKTKLSSLHNAFSSNAFFNSFNARTKQYISESFEIFDKDKDYPVDGKYYYKGGRPSWGIVCNDYDIARHVCLNKKDGESIDCNTSDIYMYILALLSEKKDKRLIIKGPAVSGKTTALYRIAYNLTKEEKLCLFFKQQASYREGLLPTIYESIKEPFVVLVDDIHIDSNEIIKMINEVRNFNVPIVFVFASRNSDWENLVSSYNKNVIMPFEFEIVMNDTFARDEATRFVEKLLECKIISINTEFDKTGYIKKFQKENNIIQTLFDLIDCSQMESSIAQEYESLQLETKDAYGIISLVYKYGYKTRWEVLQRVLYQEYHFTWEDFIEKILKRDAKGNIIDDEIQGYYYLFGRNRYICKIITHIHYDGNYTDEIRALKKVVDACSGAENDEWFIIGLLNSILKEEDNDYSAEQKIELINYTLDKMSTQEIRSRVNHMRGEFFLTQNDYLMAIKCFEMNVHDELNVEYSLHSLGKAYFFKAQKEDAKEAQFRIDIDKAIDKLYWGIQAFKRNEFYYALIIQVFNYLEKKEKLSENNKLIYKKVERMAEIGIGKEKFDRIKEERSIKLTSME